MSGTGAEDVEGQAFRGSLSGKISAGNRVVTAVTTLVRGGRRGAEMQGEEEERRSIESGDCGLH